MKFNNTNQNRMAIFIDGSNVYHTMKRLDWRIDWQMLKDYFAKQGDLVNAVFYMVEKKPLSDDCINIQSLLRKNGYKIKKKDLKEIACPENKTYRAKGNMDIELVVDEIVDSSIKEQNPLVKTPIVQHAISMGAKIKKND